MWEPSCLPQVPQSLLVLWLEPQRGSVAARRIGSLQDSARPQALESLPATPLCRVLRRQGDKGVSVAAARPLGAASWAALLGAGGPWAGGLS